MRIRKYLLPSLEHLRIHDRGYLPHWELPNGIYSLTFRLHDSFPRNVIHALHEEHRVLVRMYTQDERSPTAIENARIRFAFERVLDRELDRGHGRGDLRDERIARLVADALHHFDVEHYELYAWCVMPNHVHVVMRAGERRKSVGGGAVVEDVHGAGRKSDPWERRGVLVSRVLRSDRQE